MSRILLNRIKRLSAPVGGREIERDLQMICLYFLDDTKKYFVSIIAMIYTFSQCPGLHLNAEETKVIWSRSLPPTKIKYLKDRKFEWNVEHFILLGNTFTVNIENITDTNINLHITRMRNEIGHWWKRDLTRFGIDVVLKFLVLSKIVHNVIPLTNRSAKGIKELEKN